MAYLQPITKKSNHLSFGDSPLAGLAKARSKCLAASKLPKNGIDSIAKRATKRSNLQPNLQPKPLRKSIVMLFK